MLDGGSASSEDVWKKVDKFLGGNLLDKEKVEYGEALKDLRR